MGEIIMEGRYDLYSQGSSGWTSWRKEEFQEDDVWCVLKESKDFYSKPPLVLLHLPSASKMIPRNTSSDIAQEPKLVQQTAPVKIPDWSKIHGKHSKKVSWFNDDRSDGSMIPPHEWVAMKQARSGLSSFSVCEGAGRTLKGRDLSRVRNAVLSRTGFLE